MTAANKVDASPSADVNMTSKVAAMLVKIPRVRGLDGRDFARVGNRYVPTRSAEFQEQIASEFHKKHGGYVHPSIADRVLLGHSANVPRGVVPIRCAHAPDGSIWIDLGDAGDGCRFAHVTREGVAVARECPLAFYWPVGALPLPDPVVPKSDEACARVLDQYRRHLRLSRDQFASALSWLLCAMRPMVQPGGDLCEFPLLSILGPEGSGKTCTADDLRKVLDPRSPMHSKLPEGDADISIMGEQARVLSFDNASRVTGDLQDALCRRATGDGSETRALYTDRGQSVHVGSNPIMFTSIVDAINRSDLLSRSLLIHVEAAGRRAPKSVLQRRFAELHAHVVGALLYCVSRALRDLDATRAPPSSVRMQDACQWAIAAAPAAGLKRIHVIKAFTASLAAGDRATLDQPVPSALLECIKPGGTWTGTCQDLLKRLAIAHARVSNTGGYWRAPKGWPDSPRGLREQLRRLEPTLQRAAGIAFDWKPRGSRRDGRQFTIARKGPVVTVGDGRKSTTVTTKRAPNIGGKR